MRLIVGALVVVMLPAIAVAGFVNMEEGARATGMGGAFVGVSDDATAVFWNPAGHALTEGFKATAMRTRLFSVSGLSEDCVAASYGGWHGAGLGFEFLKHIERTRIIVHILDIMPMDGSSPAENYYAIRRELERYSRVLAQKTEIIVVNKIDLDQDGDIVRDLRSKLSETIYPISAVTGSGVKELSELLWQKVRDLKS